MSRPTSFRLTDETRRELSELAPMYNGNLTTVVTVAVESLYKSKRSNMDSKNRVLSAQLIGGYVGPEWLIEPIGEPSDQDDLDAINSAAEVYVMDTVVRGWGGYNAIIRVANETVPALGTYYLARLA